MQDVFSRMMWKQVQGIRSLFWQRWTKEYLPTLMRRSRWRKGNPNFNAGELVLLKDDDYTKRGRWPLARITRVLPGRDGVVRVVELKTKDGVYTRPVANLFKLEDNLLNDVRQGGQFVRTVKNEFKIAAYNLFQCRNRCLQFIHTMVHRIRSNMY